MPGAVDREESLQRLAADLITAAAERLYARQGWQRLGVIPDYALLPGGGLCSTTLFFKDLRE